MKLGFVSDSLAHLSFEALLDTAVELGAEGIEVNTGGWSAAPHFDLAKMRQSNQARTRFLDAFRSRGLEVIALNANGNQLHPVSGKEQSDCLHDTIRIAGDLGIEKVCLMSGLPGGGPGERTPNWVVSSWPPETQEILQWQWEDMLLPYWHDLARLAAECGVKQLAIELHGNQLVYNVPSLLRLRREIGSIVGANLDPSHLFWMGADPLAAIDALGEAIFHVHAKDTFLNKPRQATTSLLENGSLMDVPARSWSYITLGYGHGAEWWRAFCYRLRMAGYDGWLSIEHEDVMLSRLEGVRRSLELLLAVAPIEPSDFEPQAI
jgi:sugar phosphate isomerase/epimerase